MIKTAVDQFCKAMKGDEIYNPTHFNFVGEL